MKTRYAEDGVDVDEEADFSRYAGQICKASYGNSPFVDVADFSKGHFRGPRPFSVKNLPEGVLLEASTDGIGTKGIVIDAADSFQDAAYDIIAMTASDITRFGGVPLVFINVLDVVSVGEPDSTVRKAYTRLIDGLGKVAKEEGIVVLKGETAQMGVCLGSEIMDSPTKFNWSGTMIGAYHKDKMITGDTVAEGQVIVALRERGFRSNGISSLRKALLTRYGERWWDNPEAKDNIRAAAAPSILYDRFVTTLHGWHNPDFVPEIALHAVVHLSGGALREKLGKDILFPRGLSADLTDLWEPPRIMQEAASWRGIDDDEFYETWNGGQGMLLIIDAEDAEQCLARAKDFGIEAKVAGTITREERPQVRIISKLTPGREVVYRYG